jgi:hypothetical protein
MSVPLDEGNFRGPDDVLSDSLQRREPSPAN